MKSSTKSDLKLLAVISSAAVLAGTAVKWQPWRSLLPSSNGSDTIAVTDTLRNGSKSERAVAGSSNGGSYYAVPQRKIETFDFDPNTADSTTLLRLGLQPFMVRNIYKYRAAGGVYRCKEDFAQTYGLIKKDYDRLAPHIVISPDYRPASETVKRKGLSPTRPSGDGEDIGNGEHPVSDSTANERPVSGDYFAGLQPERPKKLTAGETIPLNAADSALLVRVPGIGPYYARSIIRYRQQLGGFASIEQLMEIEGFPETALPYFTLADQAALIRRIKINDATLYELRRHPYISHMQAKCIVDMRRLYGPVKSLKQLLAAEQFTEQDIARLSPYLEF